MYKRIYKLQIAKIFIKSISTLRKNVEKDLKNAIAPDVYE